jgi:hypothetical protein
MDRGMTSKTTPLFGSQSIQIWVGEGKREREREHNLLSAFIMYHQYDWAIARMAEDAPRRTE